MTLLDDTNLGYPTLHDCQLKVEGQTVNGSRQTRYLNPGPNTQSDSVINYPSNDLIGSGSSSAVFSIENFGSIMPGGYGPATFHVPDDEVWKNPLVYVESANVTLMIADGDDAGTVIWQGYLKEPTRSASGDVTLECDGWWTVLQDREDPFYWASGDDNDWQDVEETGVFKGWNNSSAFTLHVKKSVIFWKLAAGEKVSGFGAGDARTDAARAGLYVSDKHNIRRIGGRIIQNRKNPTQLVNSSTKEVLIFAVEHQNSRIPQYSGMNTALSDTTSDLTPSITNDTDENGARFKTKISGDRHSVTLALYTTNGITKFTPNNDFNFRVINLMANGDSYRSDPGVDDPQWRVYSADQMVLDIADFLGVPANYGDHQSNTGNKLYYEDSDDASSPPAINSPETGTSGGNTYLKTGSYNSDYDSDDMPTRDTNITNTNYPYDASGRIARRMRDGNLSWDVLPEWWNDGNIWDLLTHLASKYVFKVALWDLETTGFEFGSWDDYWAPWTQTWNVYAFGSQAMCTATLEPSEDIFTDVAVRYRMRHSRRWHQATARVVPNPYEGLTTPGIERKKTFHYHIKERQNDDHLARREANFIARELAGVRLSGDIGPLSYVFDESGVKKSAMLVKAGDKLRIKDFPGGILSTAPGSSEKYVGIYEVGGNGSAGPHGDPDFYFQVDSEVFQADMGYAQSNTSITIGTGSKTFTVTDPGVLNTLANLGFVAGGPIKILSFDWNSAVPYNAPYMAGTITSYNTSTHALVVNITETRGSGTFANWNIGLRAAPLTAGGATYYYSIARGAKSTSAAAHSAATNVYLWTRLRILETSGNLDEGITLNCHIHPWKLDRWHQHFSEKHKRFAGAHRG